MSRRALHKLPRQASIDLQKLTSCCSPDEMTDSGGLLNCLLYFENWESTPAAAVARRYCASGVQRYHQPNAVTRPMRMRSFQGNMNNNDLRMMSLLYHWLLKKATKSSVARARCTSLRLARAAMCGTLTQLAVALVLLIPACTASTRRATTGARAYDNNSRKRPGNARRGDSPMLNATT